MNPGVIMLSSSLYGSDGPWSQHPGFGAQGQALAGVHALTGWPDRAPAAPKGAYTDSVSPRLAASALLAAMIHREKTGKGQHVEISQIETTIGMLAPQMLELQVGGKCAERQGNVKADTILHGVFQCAETNAGLPLKSRIVSVWPKLIATLQKAGPPSEVLQGARPWEGTDSHCLERAVQQLTQRWDAFHLMDELRAAGVPAGVALKGSDLLTDKALRERRHFWPLHHPEMGTLSYNGPAYRFSKTLSAFTGAAPCLGQHGHGADRHPPHGEEPDRGSSRLRSFGVSRLCNPWGG